MAAKAKDDCAVPSCPEPMASTCSWRTHTVNADGAREYTGKTCGMSLCGAHARPVRGKSLCAWHAKLAEEQGLVAA